MKIRRIKHVQEPSHKINKRKKKLKKVLKLVKYLAVTALFVTTLIYAVLSPFFNVTGIVVKGSVHYNGQTLISASGIKVGQNGFRLALEDVKGLDPFRIDAAEKAIIERCPYVKRAKVKFIVPSTVSIEVEERKAEAILSMDGANLLIDKEGYLLEILTDANKTDLPVIKAKNTDLPIPGKKIGISEEMLLSAFEVFDTIKKVDEMDEDKLLPDVDYVDVRDLSNISFSLQARVIVNLGEKEDLYYKIKMAKVIFNTNIKKTEKGRLDFSADANPVFTPEN